MSRSPQMPPSAAAIFGSTGRSKSLCAKPRLLTRARATLSHCKRTARSSMRLLSWNMRMPRLTRCIAATSSALIWRRGGWLWRLGARGRDLLPPLAVQPHARRAHQGHRTDLRAARGGDEAAEHRTEGEAHEMKARAGRQHVIEAATDARRESFRHDRRRRRGAIAEPRQVGGDDAIALGERAHGPQPMRPRAVAAMQQDHRRPLAPTAPDHAAVTA